MALAILPLPRAPAIPAARAWRQAPKSRVCRWRGSVGVGVGVCGCGDGAAPGVAGGHPSGTPARPEWRCAWGAAAAGRVSRKGGGRHARPCRALLVAHGWPGMGGAWPWPFSHGQGRRWRGAPRLGAGQGHCVGFVCPSLARHKGELRRICIMLNPGPFRGVQGASNPRRRWGLPIPRAGGACQNPLVFQWQFFSCSRPVAHLGPRLAKISRM